MRQSDTSTGKLPRKETMPLPAPHDTCGWQWKSNKGRAQAFLLVYENTFGTPNLSKALCELQGQSKAKFSDGTHMKIFEGCLEIRVKSGICLWFHVSNSSSQQSCLPLTFVFSASTQCTYLLERTQAPDSHKCLLGSLVKNGWWFTKYK